jgi:orotate phosphoribosyltransferase
MAMANDEVLKMLNDSGALITNSHVVLTTGKHSDTYINKDALYPHTDFSSRIGELLAQTHKEMDIDVVVAPALGGIVLSQWTAFHLSKIKGKEILGVYTEKDEDKNQVFRRGYDKLVAGRKILAVEDLTTTGGSVKKVVESVKRAGGKMVAVAVMVNRNPQEVDSKLFGTPFSSLAVLKAEAWDRTDCKLCQAGVPINTDVGHGKKFLENKNGH